MRFINKKFACHQKFFVAEIGASSILDVRVHFDLREKEKRIFLKALKNLIKTGIFACFLAILTQPTYLLSETFRNEKEKFSLEYPSDFSPSGIDLHNVGLALVSKNGKFPTFNVVIESGYIDLNSPKSVKEKAVLDSYRLVGITDAVVTSSEERSIAGRSAFIVTLYYPLEGYKLRSYVALFSLSDRHYILTFIDEDGAFQKSKAVADSIVSSFKLETSDNPSNGVEAHNGRSGLFFYLFLIVVSLGITLTLLRRKRTS